MNNGVRPARSTTGRFGRALPLARPAGKALRAVLDLLLPPQCLGCAARIDSPGALCPDCWGRLRFIGPPLCACCGLPFDYDLPVETLCGACHRDRPLFNRARAALVYDDACRPLLLGFKHAD